MELIKNSFTEMRLVFKGSGIFEEESDQIIPDNRADAQRIICVRARSGVSEKSISSDRIRVGGEISCVVFCEDEEGSIYPVELNMPFSRALEGGEFEESDTVICESAILSCGAFLQNSRKIRAKCTLRIRASVYRKGELCFTSDAICENEGRVFTRIRSESIERVCAIGEKRTEINEDIRMNSGLSANDMIMRSSCEWICEEVKPLPGKVMVRGTAAINVTTLSKGGNFISQNPVAVPFSQMIDMPEMDPEDRVEIIFRDVMSEYKLTESADGGVFLGCMQSCDIFALASRRDAVDILEDIYSTGYELDVKTKRIVLSNSREQKQVRVPCRAGKRPEPGCVRVMDHDLMPGEIYLTSDGKCEISYDARVLYETTDGSFSEYTLTLEGVCDAAGVDTDSLRASDVRITCDGAGGITAELTACAVVSENIEREAQEVVSCECDTSVPKQNRYLGKLIVTVPSPGDTLWDIAKKYNSSVSAVMSANDIRDENAVPAGKMLLIPSVI